MARIEWVFFDVGNVLMDESPWVTRYHDLVFDSLCGVVPGLTRAAFEAERLAGGVRKDVTAVQHILARFLPNPADRAAARDRFWDEAVRCYYELAMPAQGIREVLDELSQRFGLGVIANQHPAIHEWMKRYDLARRFPVAVYDCDMGFGKPDTRLYTCALEQAGCLPGHAVMIGDRLDNDIAPAKAVGMWTVHLRAFGDYARREPSCTAETPDAAVDSIADIPAGIEAICRMSASPFETCP